MKFAPPSTDTFPPSGTHPSLRRCTTGNSPSTGFQHNTMNGLFTPSNSSPHFVCIQQNGGNNAGLPPTGATTLNHHTNNGVQTNGKTKEKLPQRRNSFFGSLFSSNSNKNLSSGNLLQNNGYAGLQQNGTSNNNNYSNGNTQMENNTPSNQSTSSRSSGIWMQNGSSGRESSISGRNSTNPGRESQASIRQRSISTASTTRTVLELRNIMEHRPSSAREAALETFAVIARKRICVVRKFGSHMDNHITGLLDGLGRNANTECTYLTVDQQTGAEILGAVQRPGLPLVFINGDCIGGISELRRFYQNGFLAEALKPHDYDLIVLGGGSGGISAAKEAAALGKRVACVDYLHEDGSVSGTCMNVGRVPKKLMQQASLIGSMLNGAHKYGWLIGEQKPRFDWSVIRQSIQEHVHALNTKNEKDLTENKVDYIKAYGVFSGTHSLNLRMMVDGSEREITADRFMIAVGLRSKLPSLKNAKDCCIGSDDLFTLPHNPGQTLCIGDSFISLEIASFLNALGNEVTVLLRGSRIRGFDEDVADRIQKHLISCGVRFVTGVVTNLQKMKEPTESEAGVVIVSLEQVLPDGNTEELKAEFNTVICAAGREPRTQNLNFQKPNIKLSTAGKILGRHEQSQTATHVYAVGDVLEGAVEFSQVSETAAKLLMRRLYTGSMTHTDYERVMTSVLTSLEYCACGFTEAEANQHYGAESVQVYQAPIRTHDACIQLGNCAEFAFCKALFLKSERERLIGFQILAPHAADIATGFAMAMKLNVTRTDFQNMAGVNPSAAEAFGALQPKQADPRKASY